MKRTIYGLGIIALMFSLSLTSCVSSKKFKASESQVERLQKEKANTQSQLNTCNDLVSNLKAEKKILQDDFAIIDTDLKALTIESNYTIADQARRLRNLQNIIQSQKSVLQNLKKSIADALMNYKTDELYVYTKDGNVYVSLEEKLLFKSGSDVVDPKGKEALKTLAEVLKSTSDITVMIEGHTDDVSIKTKQFSDNWDLSTSRANAIVRILTDDFGFDPMRITSAGKGKFLPVKANNTAEGRASNRRTEIILTPDLKELFNLLYQ
jgi:chemotaxis protein MotB